MPNAPLKHVAGSTVTTVVDPRFGTADTPTQPAGWGGGTGGGGSSTGTYTGGVRGAGFHVPPGALDNLTAALAGGATATRVEIAYIGDSTGYGSGPDGAGGPPRRLKTLLVNAGLPDGGFGLLDNWNPTMVTSTFSAGGKSYSFPPGVARMSTTPGETLTAVGTGTAIRIMGANVQALSYAIDGGAPVTIGTPNGAGYHYVGGLTDAQHTVVLTNVGAAGLNVGAAIEFIRDTGIVVHNDSGSGNTSNSYANYTLSQSGADVGNNRFLQYALGKNQILTNGQSDWRGGPAPRPNARNTKAAVFALGLNDMSSITSTATADSEGSIVANRLQENASLFIRMCRYAAVDPIIVVPHFQSDSRGWRFAGRGQAALVAAAEAHSAAWVSYDDALRLGGIAQQDNPHLPQSSYDVEAQFLFDNVISHALPE